MTITQEEIEKLEKYVETYGWEAFIEAHKILCSYNNVVKGDLKFNPSPYGLWNGVEIENVK